MFFFVSLFLCSFSIVKFHSQSKPVISFLNHTSLENTVLPTSWVASLAKASNPRPFFTHACSDWIFNISNVENQYYDQICFLNVLLKMHFCSFFFNLGKVHCEMIIFEVCCSISYFIVFLKRKSCEVNVLLMFYFIFTVTFVMVLSEPLCFGNFVFLIVENMVRLLGFFFPKLQEDVGVILSPLKDLVTPLLSLICTAFCYYFFRLCCKIG